MTQITVDKPILPFNDFLAYLKRQGFTIGVDQYLRLQTVLNLISVDCEPSDLRTLLCPLFATSKKQQRQFYRAFDVYFKSLASPTQEDISTPPLKKGKPLLKSRRPLRNRKGFYIILGLIFILAIFLVSSWQPPKQLQDVKEPPDKVEPPPVVKPEQPGGSSRTDAGDAPSNRQPAVKADPYLKWTTLSQFYQNYYFEIRLIGVLIPITIFLFTELYKLNHQKLVLHQQRGKNPPFVWPIKFESPELCFVKNEQFFKAARLLRYRLKSDVYHFNIDKTIKHTMELGGYPQLCYNRITKPSEYIVLIDRSSYRDHYAQLIKHVIKALENEDIIITYCFYAKNPRVCFAEDGQNRIYLSDLKAKYRDCRLIIFGNGEEFINPTSGDLDSWTSLFNTWRERAILTPVPIQSWGGRETALSREFIILPATIDGLSDLSRYFDIFSKQDLSALKKGSSRKPEIDPDHFNNVSSLRAYLGNELFQWLCACAAYPELHWDLTLYLASLPSMPKNLITEKNLIRIIRLPWFKNGIIPDTLRWELFSLLDKDKKQEVHTALIELLEKHPVPEKTFAYDNTQLNLAIQRLMFLQKDRKQRNKILKEIRSLHEKNKIQEYTSLRILESTPKSILSFVVPRRFRKVFFQNGVSAFGFRIGVRCALALLAAFFVFFLIQEPLKQKEPVTDKGKQEEIVKKPSPSVELKPIHITIDVNVKVDKALDDFFGDVDKVEELIAARIGKVFVETAPENATVRILNIDQRFQQGMELEPGKYHIKVSLKDYETQDRWIELGTGEEMRIRFKLAKIKKVAAKVKQEESDKEITGVSLDPNRIPWLQLSYSIKTFAIELSAQVQLESLPAAEVEATLIKSPQGVPIEAWSPQSNRITVNSIVDPIFGTSVKTINQVWFNPEDATALGRIRLRRGKDDFKKVYRFTEQGVFRHQREPKDQQETSKQPEKWTDVKDTFYSYNLDQLGCPNVTERLVLIYIASAAEISKSMQPLSFCVFGKRQLYHVRLKPQGFDSLKVDFIEKNQQSERRRQGAVEALKIALEAQPLASDLDKVENFSFLGFQEDIAIFIDPASNLPIQISGKIPTVGNVTIKLHEVQLK